MYRWIYAIRLYYKTSLYKEFFSTSISDYQAQLYFLYFGYNIGIISTPLKGYS